MSPPTSVRDMTAPLATSGRFAFSRHKRNWWIETVFQTWRDANDAWYPRRRSCGGSGRFRPDLSAVTYSVDLSLEEPVDAGAAGAVRVWSK